MILSSVTVLIVGLPSPETLWFMFLRGDESYALLEKNKLQLLMVYLY